VTGNLFQLGYVSDDLHRAAEWLERDLGASGFDFSDRLSLPDIRLEARRPA
jgi:hypothetical protein